jgi:hypothetical protein
LLDKTLFPLSEKPSGMVRRYHLLVVIFAHSIFYSIEAPFQTAKLSTAKREIPQAPHRPHFSKQISKSPPYQGKSPTHNPWAMTTSHNLRRQTKRTAQPRRVPVDPYRIQFSIL